MLILVPFSQRRSTRCLAVAGLQCSPAEGKTADNQGTLPSTAPYRLKALRRLLGALRMTKTLLPIASLDWGPRMRAEPSQYDFFIGRILTFVTSAVRGKSSELRTTLAMSSGCSSNSGR